MWKWYYNAAGGGHALFTGCAHGRIEPEPAFERQRLGARIRLRNDLRAQSTRLRKCLRLHGFIDAVEYGGN